MEQADNNLLTHVGLIPDGLRRSAQKSLKALLDKGYNF